jgi:sigma-E factor negative regulatory protein RseB
MRGLAVGRRWLPLILLGSSLLAGVAAASTATPSDARGWLERIHAAATQRNYQGTMVVAAGGMISSSKVAHYCVGDRTYERLEALDGRMQRVYRHNDTAHTVWPQERLVVVEKRGIATPSRARVGAADPRALEQYDLRIEGIERVAGRESQVLLLRPRDELRYAQRLWADTKSGLLLRADVIGPGRAVLESTAFSEVEIGVKAQPESVLQPLRQAEGWRVSKPRQAATSLDAEGWAIARDVPGFSLLGCVKRPLEVAGVTAGGAPEAGSVVQAVFSDGLAHVSLFIEPYAARRHKSPVQGQIGATGTLMQRRGDHWITAMGDVPPATLRLFVDAIERRP